MSQTAAQINQEILDRLNRGTEIGSTTVYHWMNRVKQRAQNQGSPLDFMYHEALALMGSGTGVPNKAAPMYGSESIVLPPNFHTLQSAKVYTGAVIDYDDALLIYGNSVAPSLFYYPSTCTVDEGLSTDYAGDNDLYPLFTNDDSSLSDDMVARGVSVTLEDAMASSVDCRIASGSNIPFLTQALDAVTGLVARVDLDNYAENPRRVEATTNMASVGYANGPWSGKVLTLANYEDYFGVESPPNYRFILLGYYRFLPDYNERSTENLLAPVPTEDIFTRTGEDLLITGALRLAYRYLNQFDQAEKYEIFERQEQNAFRRAHSATQSQAGFDELRRVREGTRIVRAL